MSIYRRVSVLLVLVATSCTSGNNRNSSPAPSALRLAVTTSTRDSGLLDILVPQFERLHDVRVDVIAVGTGAALKLGEAGDVDLVLVHAREAEDAFMAAGHAIRREDVMYNMFWILGPEGDPAGIRGMEPSAGLRRIVDRKQPFVSRGDESGTHQRELRLWHDAGIRPDWNGYVQSGQGMGATLIMADQMNGYVLSDSGTYLSFRHEVALVPLVTSSPSLRNPYGVMVIDPQKHPRINVDAAQRFVDFLISSGAQQQIRDYRIAGEPLFIPLHPPDPN